MSKTPKGKPMKPMTTMAAMAAMLALALTLPGCNKREVASDEQAAPLADTAAPGTDAKKPDGNLKVSIPQIAYIYHYAFDLPADAVAATIDRHIALCDRLGPGRCHVLGMERRTEGKSAAASLKLAVDAGIARSFAATLSRSAVAAGGSQSDSSIEAEDLSKQIVDTEARLRAKQALAARLMELLQTRKGPVADLVAAERGVADVQEEIDAAQSWLADARGRVAMSAFELSYQTAGGLAGEGFFATLRNSIGSVGSFFAQSLGMLLLLVATLLPWAVVIGLAVLGWRFLRRIKNSEDA
jgi:hypothetical protein